MNKAPLSVPDCNSCIITRAIAEWAFSFNADVLHHFRQAFTRRYSTGRHSSSALSAAVSDVKLFIKFLLDYLVALADDLSFFEMKVDSFCSLLKFKNTH